ncbi:MAG: DUF4412 domain-containing protein, partial [Synergistales bacterium]|nr:DUF4412 domain-containing protein [Synergistales bacterium]
MYEVNYVITTFSADMNIQSAAGGEMAGRVFFKDNSLRRELETPVGKQVSITEAGADLMYVLLPGQKIYTEVTNSQVTLDEKEDLEAKFSREGRVTRKGTETIEGYECDIFHIAYNDPSLGESTVWISKDL